MGLLGVVACGGGKKETGKRPAKGMGAAPAVKKRPAARRARGVPPRTRPRPRPAPVPASTLLLGQGGAVTHLLTHRSRRRIITLGGPDSRELRVFDAKTQRLLRRVELPADYDSNRGKAEQWMSLGPRARKLYFRPYARSAVHVIPLEGDVKSSATGRGKGLQMVELAPPKPAPASPKAGTDAGAAGDEKESSVPPTVLAIAPGDPKVRVLNSLIWTSKGDLTLPANPQRMVALLDHRGAAIQTLGGQVVVVAWRKAAATPATSPVEQVGTFKAAGERLVGACGQEGLLFVAGKHVVLRGVDGKERKRLEAGSPVHRARCSVAGDQVLVALVGAPALAYFAAASGWKPTRIDYAQGPASDVAFGPRGRWLAAVSRKEGWVRFWWTKDRGPAGALAAHLPPLVDVALRPDGREVASLHEEQIRRWSIPDGALLKAWKHGLEKVRATIYTSPAPELVVAAASSLHVVGPKPRLLEKLKVDWNEACGTRMARRNSKILDRCDHLDRDKEWLLENCDDYSDVDACEEDAKKRHKKCVDGLGGSIDVVGPVISDVARSGPRELTVALRGSFTRGCGTKDLENTMQTVELPGHESGTGLEGAPDTLGSVRAFAVRPGGEELAIVREGQRRPEIIDSMKGTRKHRFALRMTTAVAYSADGKTLAFISTRYGALGLADAATGRKIARKFVKKPSALAWHPKDATLLAVGSAQGWIQIRRLDGKRIRVIRTLRGHSRGIARLVWNASGTALVSGSYDGSLRVWPRPVPASKLAP